MAPVNIIWIGVIVIAIIEAVHLFAKKDPIGKPARFGIILLCLGLIVYFSIEQNKISGTTAATENTDSLENQAKIASPQIDTMKSAGPVKNDSTKNMAAAPVPKDSAPLTDTKKPRELTPEMKTEFQRDVQHYFSTYHLPANSPVSIICRMGDDRAYDFAEKLNVFLKASGYNALPITNRLQLKAKVKTTLDMNTKDNQVEINIGSGDINSANPVVLQ